MELLIGSPAIDRAASLSTGYTRVAKANPASAEGNISLVKVFVNSAITNMTIGIARLVSGTIFSSVHHTTIASVAEGYSEHIVDWDVLEGDYIFCHTVLGKIDNDSSGDGYWYGSNDTFPFSEVELTSIDDQTISLQGVGETLSVGFSKACVIR